MANIIIVARCSNYVETLPRHAMTSRTTGAPSGVCVRLSARLSPITRDEGRNSRAWLGG